MDSLQFNLTLTKKTYTLDDGNLCTGVQVTLAPMVYKFISLNNQKLALLAEIRPKFYQWFMNSPDNTSVILREVPDVPRESLDVPRSDSPADNFLN